jgi:hypothetical protein
MRSTDCFSTSNSVEENSCAVWQVLLDVVKRGLRMTHMTRSGAKVQNICACSPQSDCISDLGA